MACCAAGLVMTVVFGVSIRIFPSLERTMLEGACVCGAPVAGWFVVTQLAQLGGPGGGGGGGNAAMAVTAYHVRPEGLERTP